MVVLFSIYSIGIEPNLILINIIPIENNGLYTLFHDKKVVQISDLHITSVGYREKKMIRIGDLKYIITMRSPSKPERVNWNSISERRLFDLKNDPLEQNNLYNDLKFRRICIHFEKMIIKIIKNSSKTNRSRKETKISEETIKQ